MAMSTLQKRPGKVFNDPIHGHVELHPLLVKIIDTTQFQRLRNIKQLGGAYFVFPGASHNRFEHSIGVAYLAGELIQALRAKQPELNITDRDVLCVQIAGLCHDLGHGPFSHLYDGMFIPQACPDKQWKHETASLQMFEHLVERNGLESEMKPFGLELPEDMKFIKEMIGGPLGHTLPWPYEGRGKEKSFLYEIVANKRNGIDVDKFDYFARDCHHLGIKNNFDHQRFFLFARVCEVNGQRQICSRDKEVHNLYEMFHMRSSLHRKAYQHKVNKLIETMITDAFLKADKCIQIKGTTDVFTLSGAIDDMEAYSKLTDRVFDVILTHPSSLYLHHPDLPQDLDHLRNIFPRVGEHQDLVDARNILEKIIKREFYQNVGTAETREKPTKNTIDQWREELAHPDGNTDNQLTPNDFAIVVTTIDYGMKDKDPIGEVHFYNKFSPDKAFKISKDQVSSLLPENFSERLITVYLKDSQKDRDTIYQKHFVPWCRNNKFKERVPALNN